MSRGFYMSDFPRIITLLRKEKGLSQKQAALELGVSQALLSHYEKGIRECGLDFAVKIADYYNVSCDSEAVCILKRHPKLPNFSPAKPMPFLPLTNNLYSIQ